MTRHDILIGFARRTALFSTATGLVAFVACSGDSTAPNTASSQTGGAAGCTGTACGRDASAGGSGGSSGASGTGGTSGAGRGGAGAATQSGGGTNGSGGSGTGNAGNAGSSGAGGAVRDAGSGGASGTDAETDAGPKRCQSDLDCTPLGLLCDLTDTGTCVECNTTPQCGTGRECFRHACRRSYDCQSSLDCTSAPEGQRVCNTATNKCVDCVQSGDCAGKPADQRVCDTATNSCVDCLQNSDCAGRPGAEVCFQKVCTCGDLNTDENNCGACGHACKAGATCSRGQCPEWTECTSITSFTCLNHCESLGATCSEQACGQAPGTATTSGAFDCIALAAPALGCLSAFTASTVSVRCCCVN
jgi:hypothetical protein